MGEEIGVKPGAPGGSGGDVISNSFGCNSPAAWLSGQNGECPRPNDQSMTKPEARTPTASGDVRHGSFGLHGSLELRHGSFRPRMASCAQILFIRVYPCSSVVPVNPAGQVRQVAGDPRVGRSAPFAVGGGGVYSGSCQQEASWAQSSPHDGVAAAPSAAADRLWRPADLQRIRRSPRLGCLRP